MLGGQGVDLAQARPDFQRMATRGDDFVGTADNPGDGGVGKTVALAAAQAIARDGFAR